MEIHQLRYFAAIARLGNFTRAAEACHVSQPTLSQQIAKLELELGQSLFDRGGRGVALTDSGRVFQERVEHALTLLDDARDTMRSASRVQRFKVAAIPTVAPYLLPEVLVRFVGLHPAAIVDVREYTTDECLAHLTDGELDLAVLALPVRGDHFATEALFTEDLLLVMPARHRLADAAHVRLNELVDESFVLLHEAHCLSGQTLGFCARHALAPLVTAQLHQLATVLELVRLGQGISLVPAMAVKQVSNAGLVFRPIWGEKPTRTLGIVWSKLRFRNPLFDAFVDCLRHPPH